MLIFWHAAIIIALCFVMYKASEALVEGIHTLSNGGVFNKLLLASLFAGVATSMPEIFIAIVSSLEGSPNLAFGTAIGSNIANLGLVFSLGILLSPFMFHVHRQEFSLRTILLLLTSALFPFLLALDGSLSRVDGFFLVALFFVYSSYLFNKRGSHSQPGFFNYLRRLENFLHQGKVQRTLLHVVLALSVLLVSAHLMVKSATFLSTALGVRPFLIALFILAPGSSLPELFVAIASIRKREINVLYGDIFGSMITNANLVIGLSSLIMPYNLAVFPEYLLSLLGLLAIFFLFIYFSLSKSKFEKWEALLLFTLYLLFFLSESVGL